jgi:hypothetical protein
MAQNPIKNPKDPRYTNMRQFTPNVTISHNIPREPGKLDAGTGGRILKELELEYARGIGPVKAVGLEIWERPYRGPSKTHDDRINFSFRGSK